MNLTFVFDGYLFDSATPTLFVFDGYLYEIPAPIINRDGGSYSAKVVPEFDNKHIEKVLQEDDEIIGIIKAFLICQN